MKKLIVLVASVFMLQACDDGDITLESFNFDTVSVQNCSDNNLVFKINDNELLLLNIPATSFANEETPDGSPRIVTVSSTNQIIYRLYSGDVSSSTICSILPPASPVVEKEWNATGGTIEIITNALYASDGITITGYTHNIKFVNVNFSNSENSFSFTEYIFGNYETN
ncbi:MAG TPA: hypothetical protein VK164_03435 [Flavobacterium sp.]|uniref:hypothetical protein n=1 Tax=Flavobacterium sp. TaxID=239 RepID=UPI002B4B7194|nr:hypothetical protein [Flavobacterium sp.]HLO72965.1 hypothetical protein [Flavobacterium sp.]